VVCLVEVLDGQVKKGDKITAASTGELHVRDVRVIEMQGAGRMGNLARKECEE